MFPLKYRKSVITDEVGEGLKQICLGISERYEIHFVEIGHEPDHVLFLVHKVSRAIQFKNGKYVKKYNGEGVV
ncbi:transposase [Echinicola marina]|nr:transposase [Echinicola marina]